MNMPVVWQSFTPTQEVAQVSTLDSHAGHSTLGHQMKERPLRTTVIGSYPFPGWLEFACAHLDQFGADDRAELQEDAVIAAIHDQMVAGLDVITDGEQTRLDFNLSFYGYLSGIELESAPQIGRASCRERV